MTELVAAKVDYIITYRQSSNDRLAALQYVVSLLKQHFAQLNIIIVEQDSSAKLHPNDWPDCELIFVYNQGLFNRSWGYNVGVKQSSRPFLVFADCDVFMVKADYVDSFNLLHQFEAVDPKGHYLVNIEQPVNLLEPLKIKNKRFGNTLAGAMILLQRQALAKIGYWDEDFEGWGGEDNAMAHAIFLVLTHSRLQHQVYHIDHSRSLFDGKQQPQYQQNFQLSQQICSEHGEKALSYIAAKQQRNVGQLDKYTNVKSKVYEDLLPC